MYYIMCVIISMDIYVCIYRNSQLASSSEDGTVRLWDLRNYDNTNVLTPHMNDKVARPHLGKWIGAVDFTEDWLVKYSSIMSL